MTAVCKRCLLSELDGRDAYEAVHRAIENIPPRLKTSPFEYGQRLDLCKECDYLVAGTCMQCGCYVELRAATKAAHCPNKNKHW